MTTILAVGYWCVVGYFFNQRELAPALIDRCVDPKQVSGVFTAESIFDRPALATGL